MKQRFATAFRSLAEWLAPAPATGPIFDLTDADVAHLKQLRATEEWELYLDVLDKEQTLLGEAMLFGDTPERLHFIRGQVIGIRNAGSIIDRILVAEAERKKNDERSRSNTEHANDHRLAAVYGSPYWESVRSRS